MERASEISLESGSEKRRPIIVEIGPSRLPIHRLSRVMREQLTDDAVYVGIDVEQEAFPGTEDDRALKKMREDIETVFRLLQSFSKLPLRAESAPMRTHAIQGEFPHLPLRDASVHELWLLNVWSALRHHTHDLPKSIDDVQVYFAELARVLEEGGKVHIGEFYKPNDRIKTLRWLCDADYGQFGFSKEVYDGREAMERFRVEHSIDRFVLHKSVHPFFVTLTKK